MDRISALRNVEETLAAFENGEIDLATAEERTLTVLRTFASEFDGSDRQVYRVRTDETSRVVIADDAVTARDRAAQMADLAPEAVAVEPVEELSDDQFHR